MVAENDLAACCLADTTSVCRVLRARQLFRAYTYNVACCCIPSETAAVQFYRVALRHVGLISPRHATRGFKRRGKNGQSCHMLIYDTFVFFCCYCGMYVCLCVVSQDRWGRQRGGRKARWDKLDRQPSALKSRLRFAHSGRVDVHLYTEDALAFMDALAMGSPAAPARPNSIASGDAGNADGADPTSGSPHDVVANVVDEKADGDSVDVASPAQTSSPNKPKQQEQPLLSTAPEDARGSPHHDAVSSSAAGNSGACPVPATPPPAPPSSNGSRRSGGGSRSQPATGAPALRGGGSGSASASSSGNARGRRVALRSPPGGGSLSRSSSVGYGGGGGLGSFRGSPPPLHRKLSSPARTGTTSSLDRRGKGQKQRQAASAAKGRGGQRGATGLGASGSARQAGIGGVGAEEEVEERATPPPPPSLFESVFKDKLPSLTPRKAPPATPR